MELFAYDRYLGDEESKKSTSTTTDLEDILRKVKSRRSNIDTVLDTPQINDEIHENTSHSSQNSNLRENNVESAKRTKSKKPSKVESKAPDLLSQTPKPISEVKVKRPKKKRKTDLIVNEDLQSREEALDDPATEASVTNEEGSNAEYKVKLELDMNSLNISNEESKLSVNTVPQQQSVYTVLGDHGFGTKIKVKRVLPKWLSAPTIISGSLSEENETNHSLKAGDMKLSPKIVSKLNENGIDRLFPVQTAVIPYQINNLHKVSFLLPRDLCVCAPTGSGKTLAYVLPLLHSEMLFKCSLLHGLVIVPVQELAVQVFKVFQTYSVGTNISVGLTVGGTNLEKESANLTRRRPDGSFSSKVDILVSTPGRLTEHLLRTEGFTVKHLRWLVVDEADRVMEQRDLTWLRLIEEQCDPVHKGVTPPISFHNLQRISRPQKLLFSATLSQDPEKLLLFNLFQPMLITTGLKGEAGHFLGKFTTPQELEESYVECEVRDKLAVAAALVKDQNSLVFTKSCVEAGRLAHVIKHLTGLRVVHLSTEVPPAKRSHILKEWDAGMYNVIVASDRLARGMDLPSVDRVILYDPPKFVKGYIHRVGRTGRAGRHGKSFTLVTPAQLKPFLQLLSAASKPSPTPFSVDPTSLDTFRASLPSALSSLQNSLEKKSTDLQNCRKAEKRKKSVRKFKPRKKRINSS